MHEFKDRLEKALALSGMTQLAFAAALKALDSRAKQSRRERIPHSHRAIQNYLKGARTKIPHSFIAASADLLGVRRDWLATGTGEMTDTYYAVSTLNAMAPVLITGISPEVGGAETVARLRKIAVPLAEFPAGLAVFTEVWNRFIRSSPSTPTPQEQIALAKHLWAQVIAPLDFFGVSPKTVSPNYYLVALSALRIAIPAPGKGKRLSRHSRAKSVAGSATIDSISSGRVKTGDIFTVPGAKK